MSDHLKMIEEIERAVDAEGFRLTEWEDDFVQGLKSLATLTERQDEVLEEIWRRSTR
ncbi:MAG: hypothetical protein LLG97_12375 [Deltaproteobacteria bacterium]|nr:hypothetical protein [Deltaproteobacteria bacterium]